MYIHASALPIAYNEDAAVTVFHVTIDLADDKIKEEAIWTIHLRAILL